MSCPKKRSLTAVSDDNEAESVPSCHCCHRRENGALKEYSSQLFLGRASAPPLMLLCRSCRQCTECYHRINRNTDDDEMWMVHEETGRLFCFACAGWCRDCKAIRLVPELVANGNHCDPYDGFTCLRHEHECAVCDAEIAALDALTDGQRPLCKLCAVFCVKCATLHTVREKSKCVVARQAFARANQIRARANQVRHQAMITALETRLVRDVALVIMEFDQGVSFVS